MTKFITLETPVKNVERETVFKKVVAVDCIVDAQKQPKHYKHVMFLYRDFSYGDVFLAWNNFTESRVIYFGTKGDEFD